MSLRSAVLALAIALIVWIALLGRTWDGWAGMNTATGTVAAVADAALHGESPGHARGALLTTVYAPPFPLAVAGLRSLGLSWHAALRVGSLLAALALLAATAAAAIAAGASATGTAVALALLLAAFPFKAASLAGRGDLIAAALSVAALAAWCADREQRGWLAAVLAALAFLTKLSTLTVPLALVIAAVSQQQGVAAVRFLARWVACVVLGLLLTLPFHGAAWYLSAIGTLVAAPPNGTVLLRGPAELLRYLGAFAELAVAAALALAFLSARESRHRPVRAFGLAALLVAVAVLTNRGSDHNHLLELAAFAAACAGVWSERLSARVAALPAALVLVAVAGASWRDLDSYARQASYPDARRDAVIAAVRADTGAVLTEDPTLAVAAGRRAAIADPACLRSLERAGDRAARAVVDGLRAGRWNLVVLDQDPERAVKWYHEFHLGDHAVAALRAGYAPAGEADGFVLYRRRPVAPSAATVPATIAPAAASAPADAPPPPRPHRHVRVHRRTHQARPPIRR